MNKSSYDLFKTVGSRLYIDDCMHHRMFGFSLMCGWCNSSKRCKFSDDKWNDSKKTIFELETPISPEYRISTERWMTPGTKYRVRIKNSHKCTDTHSSCTWHTGISRYLLRVLTSVVGRIERERELTIKVDLGFVCVDCSWPLGNMRCMHAWWGETGRHGNAARAFTRLS